MFWSSKFVTKPDTLTAAVCESLERFPSSWGTDHLGLKHRSCDVRVSTDYGYIWLGSNIAQQHYDQRDIVKESIRRHYAKVIAKADQPKADALTDLGQKCGEVERLVKLVQA